MKRILIVDDNETIASIYRNKFARRGFVAEVARDGLDGLNKIEQWKPDAVLLDLMMPNIDGLAMLRTIRSNAANRELPVIVYSNSFSKNNEDEARRLGVTRLMSKSETRPNQMMDLFAELLGTPAQAESAILDSSDQTACLNNAQKIAAEMRPLLKAYFAHDGDSLLVTLQHKTHAFTANAWTAGLQKAALVGEALEVFLRTLGNRPDYASFSTDKTILQGVECLVSLAGDTCVDQGPLREPQVLIVDDQELSILTATRAIAKAKMVACTTMDPLEALRLLEAHTADLVILDIDMPELDGNTLCQHLRRIPWHVHTPVIFFSKLSEIEDRMRAATVGGSDFIAKPFLTIELSVKALAWVWKPKDRAPDRE